MHQQADLCEFEASLVYRTSFRIARAIERNPVSKNQTRGTRRDITGNLHLVMDKDRDRDPHWSTGLSSQGPNEKQMEGEHEQGCQDHGGGAPTH
ncbi:hypothetical protein ACRRTK_005306 [Alexandromys fortis]